MIALCCVELAIAARLIGITGLVISMLIINVLAHDILKGEEFTQELEAMLGVDWRDLFPFQENGEKNSHILPLAILVYAILSMVSSLFLIIGSIFKSAWCTAPWFMTETFSLCCQITALVIHNMSERHKHSHRLIVSSSVYIVVSIYIWLVIFAAQKEWRKTTHDSLVADNEEFPMERKMTNRTQFNISSMGSPPPYEPNERYSSV